VAKTTPTLPEALAVLREFLRVNCPGFVPLEVIVRGANGLKVCWPFASALAAAEEAEPFVPTAYQEAILDALEGKALRTDALAAKVGDRSRLFRNPGGLKELQEQGLVSHHSRRGYFRPDAPPEELAESES